jgi:hypothetical protein
LWRSTNAAGFLAQFLAVFLAYAWDVGDDGF